MGGEVNKAEALTKMIEKNLKNFRWLGNSMISLWCSAPFTVPKPPPENQSSIDAWMLVVDYTGLNNAFNFGAHLLPHIEKESCMISATKLFTLLDLRHRFHYTPVRAMATPLGTMQ